MIYELYTQSCCTHTPIKISFPNVVTATVTCTNKKKKSGEEEEYPSHEICGKKGKKSNLKLTTKKHAGEVVAMQNVTNKNANNNNKTLHGK